MPIYQYKGQHYDIATDDPEEAKRKIMASLPPEKGAVDYLKDFGKSTASLADTILGAPAALGQQVGYGVGRAFGLSPEEATASSLKATQPFMTPVGSAFGITQDPAYQNEATKQIGRGIESNVVQPLARVTGLPEQDVASMTNTGMMALAPVAGRAAPAVGRGVYAAEQAVGRGAQAVAQGAKTVAQAPFQAVKGAVNAATGGESALAPLGKTYVTPEGADLFRQGRIDIPTLESSQYTRPISELPSNMAERAALNIAGNQMPLAGKGAQAFGERVMNDYIANPYKAAVDIGIPLVTGVPFSPYTIGRGLQAGADYLLSRKGFDPGFPQQIAAAKTQQAFQQPQTPRLPYNPTPAPGPVAPETIYATQSGQAGTNLPQVGQVALAEKYPPYTAPPAPTPAEQAQAAAAARITQSPTQALGATAKGQEIAAVLEQRRQAELAKKQQRWAAAGVKLPTAEPTAPVAGPVAPAEVPTAQPTAQPTLLQQMRSQLNPMTPEQQAAVDAYLAKSPADKARQTRAENASKKDKDVTKMMTEEQLKMFNALKRSDNTNNLLQQLKDSGDPRAKSLAELLEKQGYNHKK